MRRIDFYFEVRGGSTSEAKSYESLQLFSLQVHAFHVHPINPMAMCNVSKRILQLPYSVGVLAIVPGFNGIVIADVVDTYFVHEYISYLSQIGVHAVPECDSQSHVSIVAEMLRHFKHEIECAALVICHQMTMDDIYLPQMIEHVSIDSRHIHGFQ